MMIDDEWWLSNLNWIFQFQNQLPWNGWVRQVSKICSTFIEGTSFILINKRRLMNNVTLSSKVWSSITSQWAASPWTQSLTFSASASSPPSPRLSLPEWTPPAPTTTLNWKLYVQTEYDCSWAASFLYVLNIECLFKFFLSSGRFPFAVCLIAWTYKLSVSQI